MLKLKMFLIQMYYEKLTERYGSNQVDRWIDIINKNMRF